MIKGKLVTLVPYTNELCHDFYRGYVPDSQMTYDEYSYDQGIVDDYFELKTSESNRRIFAILVNDKVIGEIQLKYIDYSKKHATLSIHLKDDSVKGKGYGTEAENLIINYAFNALNLDKILADATFRNERSKHILRKLGFRHIKDENEMSYFELEKIED
ncbi:GNAT family N-acetyltransferase [Acidaminobacter sp. JC074]|uniref:GNAT family N-acetyltransferase n=1 Tax=Acidaminobacter sp. JC074 TaxID=2530199 RepID=UPI001F0FE2B1|nr:GNAT family N-acetyltransferase [Acidaminobacter sp. JC074]MCH4886264.1 GNAT family N-acetyltransferase [Acidaminobacter sp. JC074]